MPLNHNTLAGLFSDIADAIRAKTGGSSQITADDFPTAIGAIQTGTPKAAQTYYPSTSDQTIASGYRLTGTQTFKGVLLTNLDAGNIKKDVVVKVGDSADDDRITSVTGTYEGSGGGGTVAEEKDVNFIDYDGTIVYSYTAAEFANLSALPANPTHTGLTAQGWNWSLSDAKTYVASYGKLWIGQMYVTSSGDTEIDCDFDNADLLTPYLKIAVNGTVTVDWGDGSATDTVTGTSLTTSIFTQHTYAIPGNYTISISVTSGRFQFNGQYILSDKNATSDSSRRYTSCITALRIGSGITSFGNSAFYYCYSLRSVTIPNTVTSIGTSAFYYCAQLQTVLIPSSVTSISSSMFGYCYSLRAVSLPYGVTSIGQNAFYYCYSLCSVTIPNTVTSVSTYLFYHCYSLRMVIIPNTVTSISNYMFYNCYSLCSVTVQSTVTSIGSYSFGTGYSLHKIIFKPTSPPTVSNSNAFNNLPTDCIIYVPYSADHSIKNLYTSANNYPSSSTYTYVEET